MNTKWEWWGWDDLGVWNWHIYTTIYKMRNLSNRSVIKNLPAMWETQVQFLGWEDPLEKGTATNTSILNWKIPWTEELGWATVLGVTKSWTQLSD